VSDEPFEKDKHAYRAVIVSMYALCYNIFMLEMDLRTRQDVLYSIHSALDGYQQLTNGKVKFNLNAAAHLNQTPEKPYTARSTSLVEHLGETAGNLTIIVFDEDDATGNESDYELREILPGGNYPLIPKVVPRKKDGIRSEAHLPIATLLANRDPAVFANSLDLIGVDNNGRLTQLACLGQDPKVLFDAYHGGRPHLSPAATLTTGFNPYNGERFGDPHAVYNKQPFVQIAGFLALTDDMAAEHASMFSLLGAQVPVLRS